MSAPNTGQEPETKDLQSEKRGWKVGKLDDRYVEEEVYVVVVDNCHMRLLYVPAVGKVTGRSAKALKKDQVYCTSYLTPIELRVLRLIPPEL